MRYFFTICFLVTCFIISESALAQMLEDFEDGDKNSYAPFAIELSTGEWFFDDALIGSLPQDKKNGSRSARIRDGFIQMNFDYPQGLSELSFFAANFSSDSGGAVKVSFSTNQGETWEDLSESISLTSDLTEYTLSASIAGNVRLRFTKTGGNRINIDDVLISDYIEVTEHPSILVRVNNLPYENGSTWDFGVNLGDASANLQIRNTGQEDLVIASHTITGEEFTVEGDVDVTLGYLETAALTLHYQSADPGVKLGALTLNTNDPENQEFVLNLRAETLDTNHPISIAEARLLPMGTLVTIAGWVTVAEQFAGPVYFQDQTAGIAWYNGEIMRDEYLVGAVIGDSLLITGHIGQFNNLLQIVEEVEFFVFPEANTEIEPLPITIEQLNTGDYEGLLVEISEVEFSASGIFSGGTNYIIFDQGGEEGELRVDNFTNIPGTPIPNSTVAVRGVAGRFGNTHQILPRFTHDIEVLVGPIITTPPPFEVSATDNSITFEWNTVHPGHSEIRYGFTPSFELGAIIDEEHKTSHSITLEELDPATVYKVQLRSAFDADTSATALYITSTGSPAGSTGNIHVFFNKDVAHEIATFQQASQDVHFGNKLIEFIDMAEETAEFAFYSISGTVGGQVAAAIIAAHQRGVDVRVIASGHTGTTNQVIANLAAAGVKAVQSTGIEQMHNKFAIIDAHHHDPAKPWLITSSWNATDQGTNTQYQNMVTIQDVALARAYLREFNQMWGGESGNFNAQTAKFSFNKSVVNPSVFWLGEEQVRVELYFSPQGNTEAQINRNLSAAFSSIDICLNLITRRTMSNTMRSRFNDGVAVRGVLGDVSGASSEWEYLSGWADVHHFSQAQFGLLHHKYAIVDGRTDGENARVITGSHNWSANANFRNDENTLVIHSPRVANEYFQEYAARYWQAGGNDEFDEVTNVIEFSEPENTGNIKLWNYPNPFSTETQISFELAQNERLTLNVYDITGRLAVTLIDDKLLPEGRHMVTLDAGQLGNGFYICRLELSSGQSASHKIMSIR